MEIRDFGGFETFIAPMLIKIVYWIGLFFIALGTIGGVFGMGSLMSYGGGGGFSFGGAVLALIGGLMSVLVWRVICEIWIVIFSINDRLGVLAGHETKTPHVAT